MAKFSVHVPDDLWEEARAISPDRNASQLVQQGLRRLVAQQHGEPSYVGQPEGAADRIQEIQVRLAAEARDDYERGYRIALDAASDMSLHMINDLVDLNFDLRRWLEPWKRGWMHEQRDKAQLEPKVDPDELWESLRKQAENPVPPAHDDSRREDNGWWWLWKAAEALGEIAAPIDVDEYSFHPTLARQRGFSDAMRAVWLAVEVASPRDDLASSRETDQKKEA
ncbi:MAG TPA: hypothetical protein VME22_32850 [Solirubrobacteraceae bacterium]|nr:hypothetical protein [Solirubrobacteraceae bacterium]